MKKFQFTVVRIVILSSFLIAFSSSIMKKQSIQARYTQSNLGSLCLPPTTLPGVCTETNTGVLCETALGGGVFRSWYKDACVNPYYRIP